MRLILLIVSFLFCHPAWSQHLNPWLPSSEMIHSYEGGDYGGGVSVVDMNSDGWDDVCFSQNGSAPTFLMNNEGSLGATSFPLNLNGEIKHISWVDVDNDGDRDMTVTGINMPVRLFWNTGGMSLVEAPPSVFGTAANMTYGHSWADYDRDGDLDLFVANYDGAYTGYTNSNNLLYRNEGNGAFTETSALAGIYIQVNYTFMGLWTDFNHDLWPDLFILNDRYTPNYMFMNLGNGTFADVTDIMQLDDFIFSMSATGDDHDNDGDMDYYITNGTAGNVLRQNQGGVYADVANEVGALVQLFCWSAQWTDFDNDGWQDLHICCSPHINYPGINKLLKNVGGEYTDISIEAGIQSDVGWSRGSAIGDFNRDGFPDLVVSKSAPDISTYWITESNSNHWLTIDLEGTESNVEGIGAWVSVFAGGDRYTRYTTCGEGYLGQNSFRFHVGMGTHDVADSIVVEWPSGVVDHWRRIPANQHLNLLEGTSRWTDLEVPFGVAMCVGDSIPLDMSGWYSVEWSNGDNSSAIWVDEPASLSALVMDDLGNQFLTDTIFTQWYVTQYEVSIVHPQCADTHDGVIEVYGPGSDSIAFASLNGVWSETPNWSALDAGLHLIEVESIHGCSWSTNVELSSPSPLQLTWTTDTLPCAGDQFGWMAWQADPVELLENVTIVNGVNGELSAGAYDVQVLDTNGCAQWFSVQVIEPSPISIALDAHHVLCASDSSGLIEAVASGGTGELMTTLNEQPGQNWSVPAGNYQLTSTDENGCVVSEMVEIQEPAPFVYAVDTQPDLNDESTGVIVIAPEGGTPPYSVFWNNQVQDDGVLDSLAGGFYTGVILDANGCSVTWEATVDQIQNVDEYQVGIRLWPNPAANLIYVEGAYVGTWRCWDAMGRLITSGVAMGGRWIIPTSNWSSGYYVIEFESASRLRFPIWIEH
jgi:hypothetical protein